MRSVYLSPLLLIWLLMLPRAALAFAVDIWPDGEFSGQPLRQQWPEPAAATKPLTLCALYPHLRDAYWLSVNQGMVDEAKRLGVKLQIHEAGGTAPSPSSASSCSAACRKGATPSCSAR